MTVKNRALRGAVCAGLVTVISARKLKSEPRWLPKNLSNRWDRINHRGESVSLIEGPALAAGLTAGAACAGSSGTTRAAATLAIAGAGVFGIIDDLAETTDEKGLRGHVGALLRGKLTTGGLKIIGIGATSLAAASLAHRRGGLGGLKDVALSGTLIAASANLANLFDLRPGRVLKVTGGAGLPLALIGKESGVAGAVVGASLAAAPGDLAEETMAGDGGANALGAAIGATIAFSFPRWVRIAALLGVGGLTVASEKWSFSQFIDSRPALRAIDSWGRRR